MRLGKEWSVEEEVVVWKSELDEVHLYISRV